jgi:NitT/TauT family transport system substrate-binding protein
MKQVGSGLVRLGTGAALVLAGCREQPPRPGALSHASEVTEVRIARQHGLGYLPLVIMQEQGLIEKQARAEGLGEIKTTWTTLTGGAAATDALLSESVDYIATGVTPLITLWAKSGQEVKGVAALDSSPVVLNTVNPGVKSLRDLTERDRIAVPAVKVSIQAVILQMAAAKEFGEKSYARLDPLTVTMKHPDAAGALLSGHSEISAHLASPPFSRAELKDPRVHAVLNSFDVLGGPHTLNILSTTRGFYERNPKTYAAVTAALEEAMDFIAREREAAADLYLKSTGSRESRDEIVAQLADPSLSYASTPRNVARFSDFMYRTGAIQTQPDWKDLFFPPLHSRPGS